MATHVFRGGVGRFLRRAGLAAAVVSAFVSGVRAQDGAVPADKTKFHVFVLMGQSNMAGSGSPILPEYTVPNPRVLVIGGDLKWTPFRIKPGAGMGPGAAFARHYAELHPDVTVGLIQGARGGRGLKELAKGGKDRDGAPNYDNTMAKVREAMKSGTVKAVLWHQGETDAGDAAYVDKLKVLVADLRADIGDPELPFIAGELGRYAPWTAPFNSRIPAAKTAIPRCAVASSEGLLDLGDKVHFSGFSCETLGARYLMEYLTMTDAALAAKFQPVLAEITARMQAGDAGWKTVINPSMTEGGAWPLGWDGRRTTAGTLNVSRDTADAASAPASLKVESVGGPVTGSVTTPLRDVCGRQVKISCRMKNAGFATCGLALTALDGSWKQVLNQDVIDAKGAGEWTLLSGEFLIPPNAVNVRLALVVGGEGAAWLDDVSVEAGKPASAAKPAAPAPAAAPKAFPRPAN